MRLGPREVRQWLTRWPLNPGVQELCFVHWDDIARENWPTKPLIILRQLSDFARVYVLNGNWIQIAGLCPGAAMCGLYPLMVFLFALLAAGLFAFSIAIVVISLVGKIWLAMILALMAAAIVMRLAWSAADGLGVVWLTRSILFTHRLGQARDQALRRRVVQLADAIVELEQQVPAQKPLLIGHSSGSFVMAMLAAELKRRPEASALVERLELLSLGQNFANLAFYPRAELFRHDLMLLATPPRLTWLDITSVDDLLCFAGVNPFESCGLPLPEGEAFPTMQLVDLRGPRGLTHKLQWLGQLFELHFDYLCKPLSSFDLAGLLIGNSSVSEVIDHGA